MPICKQAVSSLPHKRTMLLLRAFLSPQGMELEDSVPVPVGVFAAHPAPSTHAGPASRRQSHQRGPSRCHGNSTKREASYQMCLHNPAAFLCGFSANFHEFNTVFEGSDR